MSERRRIVVKVGSNVLTTADGKLHVTRMSAIVDEVVWLRRRGYDVVLVSSGAVTAGRKEFDEKRDLDGVQERQLFSAMGQVKLINLYYQLFREYGYHMGQVLTMKTNFTTEQAYNNQRACVELMLENGVIPVVNENDTVSLDGLMFTDNDELAGLIARMISAQALILLSNVDGLYSGDPSDKDAYLIREVRRGDDFSHAVQGGGTSPAGRGGMASKYATARQAAAAGIRVVIANGTVPGIIRRLTERPEETPHTLFV